MKQVVLEFDFLSLAIWIPTIVCLTLVMQFGRVIYAWTSEVLIALYIVTVVLLVLFVMMQVRHGDSALALVRIWKRRSLACLAFNVIWVLFQTAEHQVAYFMSAKTTPA